MAGEVLPGRFPAAPMTEAQARAALLRNFPHCDAFEDSSFVGRLHETGHWHADEYWRLDAALYALADDADRLPRDLAWPVVRIFSYVTGALQAHVDPADGFTIAEFEDPARSEADAWSAWRERLQLVVEGFFSGALPADEDLELHNPRLR